MKRFFTVFSICIVACQFLGHAIAADLANGQALAKQCSVCHGKTGIANESTVPNLAGQQEMYLQKSLQEYRSGVRQDRRMSLMAQNLTDQDISDLAAWYASFVVEVTVPDP